MFFYIKIPPREIRAGLLEVALLLNRMAVGTFGSLEDQFNANLRSYKIKFIKLIHQSLDSGRGGAPRRGRVPR